MNFLSDCPGSYVEVKWGGGLESGSSFGLNVVESICYNESIQLHQLYNKDWGIRNITFYSFKPQCMTHSPEYYVQSISNFFYGTG